MSNKPTYKSNAADIVYDIADGKLTGDELNELIEQLELHNKLGSKKVDRIPKEKWDEEYLNKLKNDFFCSSLSREYLLYVYEVADYVHKKKRKSPLALIIAVCVILVFIVSIVVYLSIINTSFEKNDGIGSSNSLLFERKNADEP